MSKNKETPTSQALITRSKTASAQELVHRDGRPVRALFELESPQYLGSDHIPFEHYTSQAIFDRELTHTWSRTWQWACREEHIAGIGDYSAYEIGHYSVFIVRSNDSTIKAYVNSCLHRATNFRQGGADDACTEIRCPFLGWTWDLEGSLLRGPYTWDAAHVAARDFSLPQTSAVCWSGFVFINLDPDAESPGNYLALIPERFSNFAMQDRSVELHIDKELHCNWKVDKEAFIKNYHTQETHPQLRLGSDDEGTPYDVFTDFVPRFFCALGVSSPLIHPAPSEQELVDMMLVRDRSVLGDDLQVKPEETARIVMARVLRRVLAETYDYELSHFTDTEMINVSQHGLLPNMILFPELSLPMVYRFRPLGNDPSRTLFALLILRPIPDTGTRPKPASPINLTEPESFRTVLGFDKNLAKVYDQDTGNLRLQQEGLFEACKPGETPLNYQKAGIQLLHQTLN